MVVVAALSWAPVPGPAAAQARPDGLLPAAPVEAPAVGRACRRLLGERDDKARVRDSLAVLLARSSRLLARAPGNKETVRKSLRLARALLEQKVAAATERIRGMEEGLILRGCPVHERLSGSRARGTPPRRSAR